MTEEPYRWLEAIENRREYVREQLKPSTPVFAASVQEGVLLLGIGEGQSKVFEIFDRHGLAALGHPSDIERLRQGLIDAAHLESFARASEDVTLRRLVSAGLSAQLKQAFEQVYSAPVLVESILAEVGGDPDLDVLARVKFDGAFRFTTGGVAAACADPEVEGALETWLQMRFQTGMEATGAARLLLAAWVGSQDSAGPVSEACDRAFQLDAAARTAKFGGRVVEAALLRRGIHNGACYEPLCLEG